ncbi:MAG: ABC transporter permease [Anaerolineales bacterium]|nr:ABC transporter permease [Anaerolineales bacterium]
MIADLFTPAVLIGIATSGIRLATPYLYATIGETLGQLSGVLNLGVDGIMLMGAFAGFYVTFSTGQPFLGLLAAIVVGALMGFSMAVISIAFHADQGISGIGVYLFGLGMSDLLFQKIMGTVETVRGFTAVRIPLLADIPVVGEILFDHNILVYIAFALIPLTTLILDKTTWGLQIKAAGQNPAAADSVGVNVKRVRYITVTLGGVFSGIAGASLSIALLNVFQMNMTAGMGFIAVALVYFGGWRPKGVLLGSLLFSLVNALQNWVQVLNIPIPSDFAVMMPYVLTILALIFAVRKVNQPAALSKAFERGES